MNIRWCSWPLGLAVILTACASQTGNTPSVTPSVTTSAPPAQSAPLAPAPTTIPRGAGTAASLFPDSPRTLTFAVWDQGAKEADKVTEQLIPDGDHLVATYGGKPYATWAITATGIWRLDPKGGGAMLRYLPAVLKDGETWQQTSGDATVAFHLQTDGMACRWADGNTLSSGVCWTLTVLNRGERITYTFTPGLGPTAAHSENFAHPDTSYLKGLDAVPAKPVSDADVQAARTQAPPAKETNTPVSPLDPSAFDHMVDQYPGVKSVWLNLKEGGQLLLRGVLDTWTPTAVEVFDRDFKRLGQVTPPYGYWIKVRAQTFQGDPSSFVLLQQRVPGGLDDFTILVPSRTAGASPFAATWGWDRKTTQTIATDVSVQDDGQVTVAWEMGDPAQHKRIRLYHFDAQKAQATLLSEQVVPSHGDLRYPTDPLALLHAAFIAHWFDLKDELPRYFATPQAAAAFQAAKLTRPWYDLGKVSFATLSPAQICPKITPGTLDANHTAPFVATAGEYEGVAYIPGTVTFGQDAQGRWVIQLLRIDALQGCGD